METPTMDTAAKKLAGASCAAASCAEAAAAVSDTQAANRKADKGQGSSSRSSSAMTSCNNDNKTDAANPTKLEAGLNINSMQSMNGGRVPQRASAFVRDSDGGLVSARTTQLHHSVLAGLTTRVAFVCCCLFVQWRASSTVLSPSRPRPCPHGTRRVCLHHERDVR